MKNGADQNRIKTPKPPIKLGVVEPYQKFGEHENWDPYAWSNPEEKSQRDVNEDVILQLVHQMKTGLRYERKSGLRMVYPMELPQEGTGVLEPMNPVDKKVLHQNV